MNRFVADFLGKATFFEGDVESVDGDMITIKTADGTVTVPGRGADAGEGVHYALRPEKVKIYRNGEKSAAGAIDGVVESVIYSGNLMSCTVNCSGISVKAEMGGTDSAAGVSRGETVAVAWEPEALIKLDHKKA